MKNRDHLHRYNRNGTQRIAGPFAFATGPLFFLSATLAAAVTSNATLTGGFLGIADRIRNHIANRSKLLSKGKSNTPWEDVWLGFAISQVQLPSGTTLALLNVNAPLAHVETPFASREAIVAASARSLFTHVRPTRSCRACAHFRNGSATLAPHEPLQLARTCHRPRGGRTCGGVPVRSCSVRSKTA